MPSTPPFLSAEPTVELVQSFDRPFNNAVATARTCYSSKGIVTSEDVGADHETDSQKRDRKLARRDALARDIYKAGHHTTLQHNHVQFALTNVSRHFLWSFLHSHPFYNSEQVSQRYVTVSSGHMAVPPLAGEALSVYQSCVKRQTEDYLRIIKALEPSVETAFYQLYPSRKKKADKFQTAIQRRCQEVARYVLPVATFAYLYHTVSALTVLRYHRMCGLYDAPHEQRLIVGKMVKALVAHDPLYQQLLEDPLPLEDSPEFACFLSPDPASAPEIRQNFRKEFDLSLQGYTSKLVDYKQGNEGMLAASVREVLGLPGSALSDDDAIDKVLNPANNTTLGETMNVSTLSKLSRTMHHPAYTFRKKLSHSADSQDQRHRMTPASRPVFSAYAYGEPDYVTPFLVLRDEDSRTLYDESMKRTWDDVSRLRSLGVSEEYAAYLMPNAVSIRFTESTDLLNLHHKLRMRLCYNAQEEIWLASLDEARQVRAVNPRIGKFLLPPCGVRAQANTRPVCPEGNRYCGIRVWELDLDEYRRSL